MRFSIELERFFNQHDFITVDSLTGNFTIGEDIVGELIGDTASGTFNINTDYKCFFDTPQQWVDNWNNREGLYIFPILSGSFKHQIACKYFIRRRKVDDHFEYDVTYTGKGVWDFTMRLVKSINTPVPIDYIGGNGECFLRLEDINIDTESIGGDVKLEYTTTLK